MATKTLRVFAEYTSTGFVPMPTAGNIDYGFTLGSTFPATTPTTFQTDNPDLVVTVTAMTDFYVWIRINGTAWNPSYTRNVRVYPDSPNINNVVMNMIIATGPAGVSSYTQIVQTSNRLYFNGATTDSVYNSKFAGKTYINELNFGTAPGLATVATSGAYADLTGKPTLATVATSGLFTDLSSKPSGTAPLSYNSGTNSFVITQANTSTNGYLSSTDWNTFNNKLGTPAGTTLQYVDGTGALQTFPVLASADKLVINVRNASGVSMPKGSVVYINGATGNKPTVALAQANSDASSAQTLGLLQTTLANNAEGNVIIVGSITDLNTSAFTEGQQLYLSPTTAGAYTTTKPYAPNHLVYVGVVTRAHPTQGVIEVKVQNGYEMDELHDVSAQSPSNNDGLFYNTTTSLWEKKSIATVLGYTPYNGTDTSIKALFSASAPLSYSNGVYSISQATTASNGYLSSTDWNTFNGKTLLNGTGFVKATGTTITYDNTSYLPLTGNTMSGSIGFSDSALLKRGMYGTMGGSDYWFIGASATATNGGYIEIATGDDATEPIYIRQYSGDPYTTGTVARTATILDASGNTTFPNTLTATTLVKSGGTSSQFLKADGSIDTSVYLTTASASSTYQTIITNPVTGTGTINELAYWNSASSIASLTVATYPSLTELAYVKGVTSAIQTQLNAKASSSALSGYLPLTGGTLTGALGGTSATFSDTVTINKTGASILTLGQGTSTNDYGRINFYGKGTGGGVSLMYMPIYNTQSGSGVLVSELEVAHEGSSADNKSYFSLKVHNGTSLINPLYIASTGAATFSIGNLSTTIGASSGNWISNSLKSDLGNNSTLPIINGKANSFYNAYTMIYNHIADGSANNFLGLGFYGLDNSFKLYANGVASFSNSVNIITNGNPLFLNNSTNTTSIGMKFTNGGGNYFIGVSNSGGTGYLSGSAYAFNIQSEGAQALQLGTNNANRMTITSAGIVNLYSPTTNADALNLYNSSGKLNIKMGGGGGGANQSSISMYNASNTLTIGLNGAGDTDPSFITGYLAIGTTTNSGYRFYVSGTIYATGNITANSDLTLKKNLKLIDNPIDKLMQLNGYAYQWKANDEHQYGVIAQEVEKILPYAVSTGNDGIKGVSYNQITPLLIEGFKSHESEITILKARVKYLESKLA